MSRHALLKATRLIHLYFGVFITPALIFFAFTGAVQTFGLHETNRDHPTYVPARWLVVLGQIHKKQTPIVATRKPQPAAAGASAAAGPGGESAAGAKRDRQKPADAAPAPGTQSSQPVAAAPAAPQKKPHPLPLRIFFLIVAIGLLTSTVTGLYMSYKFVRNKALITVTLIAGILIPILLTLL